MVAEALSSHSSKANSHCHSPWQQPCAVSLSVLQHASSTHVGCLMHLYSTPAADNDRDTQLMFSTHAPTTLLLTLHLPADQLLQSRRNVLLYAGAAVTGIAGLAALLNGGGGDSVFGDVDSKERSSIGRPAVLDRAFICLGCCWRLWCSAHGLHLAVLQLCLVLGVSDEFVRTGFWRMLVCDGLVSGCRSCGSAICPRKFCLGCAWLGSECASYFFVGQLSFPMIVDG
jgi:hypothetical protein